MHAPSPGGHTHCSFSGPQPVLLKAVGRARRWFEQLASGRATSLAVIASQAGISVRFVGRLIRLAFLAPPLVEMIAQGRQPSGLTAEMLTRRVVLPPEWEAQKRLSLLKT